MRVAEAQGSDPGGLPRRLDRAESAILAASGDLLAIADALTTYAVELTSAVGSSMFEMRGGHWVRTGSSVGTERPITFPLPLGDVITRPLLVADSANDPQPAAQLALSLGVPCVAIAPLFLWPDVPAMVSISGVAPGSLGYDDLATLAVLTLTAGVAAYRTPRDHVRSARAVESLAWHQEMLEGIARGVSMQESLRRVCLEVESRYPTSRCSVLLADHVTGVLSHAAGPSLPPDFVAAINGMAIADGNGACGTAAATGQSVVIVDIAADVRAAPYRALASSHQLRSAWSYPLRDARGEVIGTFAIYRSQPHTPDGEEQATVAALSGIAAIAIERFRFERALTDAARRDPLTSLGNRAMFRDLLEAALEAAALTSTTCAVMFLDLDGFKTVNDSLGHAAGDRLLVEVAGRLVKLLPPTCVVARFGGDEFTILVRNASADLVNQIADAVDAALFEPFVIDGGEFFLSTAIGIAMSDSVSSEPGSVMRDADAAMYAAKSRGRGRRKIFDAALRERAVARASMEGELRRAIREGSLQVVYQPLIDLQSRTWCGAEALARWDHPALGGVLPADFIPLAEELGLMGQLGDHVLAEVMKQARDWDEAGIAVPIAINISPSQLADPGVVGEVLGALHRSGVRPELVCLEITENAVMENPDLASRLLQEFGAAGVRSVIDDFGTGHSSIARLAELPVSAVKIDKSFLAELGRDVVSTRVVAAIINLAHAFGLVVTAEGVETTSALRVLGELGCDQAQGYLFGRPATAQETAALLAFSPALAEPDDTDR